MHKPANLQIPQSEYIETDTGRYRIEPIARLLSQFNAGTYAKAVHTLGAAAWQEAAWAKRSIPDDVERKRSITEHFDPSYDKFLDKTGHRIAQIGRFALTIGLFDVTTDAPMGHPSTLRGFVQPNLEVSGSRAKVWQKRHNLPQKVYPSLGGGPELAVEVPIEDRELLYNRLFAVAVSTFKPEDIGTKFRNTLDVYLTATDYEAMVKLSGMGANKIFEGVAPVTYVGSPLERMQFPDLAQLQQAA